eukprot:TRINITY_DN5909_c0_g1_i1.p1 TRINITY_DN5909_c0_g1~~TRINITY_DN5909_c0_g1_i1.p1  ORF type:complete len:392 (-),score=85.75 TRINITY_DN5909_c0_g1_i1:11-1186(-)
MDETCSNSNLNTIEKKCPSLMVNTSGFVKDKRDLVKSMKCKQCGLYFSHESNSPTSCIHHHGLYRDPGVGVGGPRWGCCLAFERNRSGCCVGQHLEDTETTKQLDGYQNLVEGRTPQPEFAARGWLRKKSGILNRFDRKFYILNEYELQYWKTDQILPGERPQGVIDLRNCRVFIEGSVTSPCLNIYETNEGLTHRLYADTSGTLGYWETAIKEASTKSSIVVVIPSSLPPYQPPRSASEMELKKTLVKETKEEVIRPKPIEPQDPNVITHVVQDTDTLTGICLRYNTSPQVVKKFNRMMSDQVITRKIIYIPHDGLTPLPPPPAVSEELRKKRLVNNFMHVHNIKDFEEAQYYLDEGDWDNTKASVLYQQDQKWSENPPIQSYIHNSING